ncbi:tail fiber protein [Bradyrhizobium sp.]|uniref:tail fiber protein n=1 Tax=Bradyrhizobium sp. TaxID=376 RepID=UPI0039E41BF8
MAFVRARARILELSTTSGSGPLALAGAADNSYNTFSSFMSIGDTTYVSVVEPGVAFWTGIATYSASNELTLTTVEETKGTFGAGTKEIMAGPLASTSMFREDITGAIVTGGTATAYTVASYRKYDSLSRLDGNIIAFTPHAMNGQGVTLNVDGLGPKPLRLAPGVDLGSNVLVTGSPYTALYRHTDQSFYLHALGGNAYGIPLGGGMDFWGATPPSSAFALMYGQALSRTTYAKLFDVLGTTHGAGDGATTFNIPDHRGRVAAGRDDMGGTAANRLSATSITAGGPTTLGGSGGADTKALATLNLPPYTPSFSVPPALNLTANLNTVATTGSDTDAALAAGNTAGTNIGQRSAFIGTKSISYTFAAQGGASTPFSLAQPTIIANKLLRVL